MRTLSATTAAEVVKTITAPFYLIELDLAIPQYLSTRGTVDWNGITWTGNGARVDELRELAGGALAGRVSLSNTDGGAAGLVLDNDVRGRACVIRALYGDGPYAVGDEVEIFRGELDGSSVTPTRVTIDITTEGRAQGRAPRLRWLPPLANHLPAPGTLIHWGGESFRLEGAD